jgi:cytochrome bd-type quinol oxidase subunit 2
VPGAVELDDDDDLDAAYDDDEEVSRWVSLVATIGTALVGIVTIQVVASIVEGLSLKRGERVGVPDDILHRLGYPFGGLGTTALVFLVLGVVLISLPYVMGEYLGDGQERLVGVAFGVAVAMAVIIAIGSILAVRANLHEYAAKGVSVPTYVRVQFTNFLLGSLGAAALALYGSLNAMSQRSRERLD